MQFLDTLAKVGTPVGAGISALGGIFTSAVNRHSQKETNKRQMEMQEREIAFNREMWDKQSKFNSGESQKAREWERAEREAQQKWQESQIRQQQMYDSAGAQIQRLRNAGINTAVMNGTTGAGGSAAPAGVPSGSTVEAQSGLATSPGSPHLSSPMFDVSPVTDLVNAVTDMALKSSQKDKLDAESERIRLLMQGEWEEQGVRIRYEMAQTDWTEKDAQRVDSENSRLQKTIDVMNKQIEEYDARIRELDARTDLTEVQKEIEKKRLAYFDKDKAMEYAMGNAQIKKWQSEANVNAEEVKHIIQQVANLKTDNALKSIPLNIKMPDGHSLAFHIAKSEGEMQIAVANAKGAVEGSETAQWIAYGTQQLNSLMDCVVKATNVTDRFLPSQQSSNTITYDKRGNVKSQTVQHQTKRKRRK